MNIVRENVGCGKRNYKKFNCRSIKRMTTQELTTPTAAEEVIIELTPVKVNGPLLLFNL